MARKNRAVDAEIAEIDRLIAALQQRRSDLLAYKRVEGTIGKGPVAKQLPLLEAQAPASEPVAEKRSRAPSRTTIQVSMAAQRAIEALGPLRTKDLARHLPAEVRDMLGDTEEKVLQRLSQIMSREAKRGKFTINLKTGWGLRQAGTVVPFGKQA